MQVTETLSEGLKREYKVVVPAADLDSKVENRLLELSKTVKMKGFRPGKVPLSIIRRQYRSAVLGEVLESTVQSSSQQALSEQAVRPAMQPKIEIAAYDEGKDLEYTMGLELLPEIALGDFSEIELVRLTADVSDDDVEVALGRIAEAEKRFAKVDDPREAKLGDALSIDFEGRIDGEAIEGGAATDFELELGSGSFIPGFEDQLIGAKTGEDKLLSVTFPEGYPQAKYAGKQAQFEVTVKELRERQPVAVDDDLAKRQGLDGVADLAALEKFVRERIEEDFAQASRARFKRSLLDHLAENYDFEVPVGMVDQEFGEIWAQIERDKERADASYQDLLGQSEEEARTEYRQIAERRVRLGLLLSEIGGQNGLTVERDDLLNAAMTAARQSPNPQQVLEFYGSNPNALERFRAPVYEDKVVSFLTEIAKVVEKKVAAEELFRDPDEDEAQAVATTGKKAASTGAAGKGGKSGKSKAKSGDSPPQPAGGAKGGKKKPAKSAAEGTAKTSASEKAIESSISPKRTKAVKKKTKTKD